MAMRGLWTAVMAALLVIAPACSSNNGSNDGGAGGTGGSGGSGGGAGGPPAGSCQAIRLCALDCADDACVTNTCLPRGNAAAQTQFQALYDCTKVARPAGGGCATPNDVDCLCLAQCLQDPPCGEMAIECAGAGDNVCDVLCH
jgi:hypothetical protein